MTKKRIALVTGASSGIGEASAKKLLAAGYTVYGTSRRGAQAGTHPFALLTLDVTDDASVSAAIEALLHLEGRIDLLVNNALGLLRRPRKKVRLIRPGVFSTPTFLAWSE